MSRDAARHAEWSRRDVLRAGLATAAAGVPLAACAGCALFLHRAEPDAVLAPDGAELRLPADLSRALADPGSSAYVRPEGADETIVVFRTASGTLHALSAVCTHRGCDVEFDPGVDHVVCPCHGSEYAVDGGNLQGPADEPLRRHAVRVEDGRVVIAL